jgi:GH35 family endo-1,4-beta-xylanase
MEGANARIEKYRRADATVTVVDKNGRAVADAELQVEQIRHAFLFGCNIFKWGNVGNEQGEAEYRRRFAEVFNFATLPFYWPSYEAREGEPIHDKIERAARWCKEQNIRCKGHPLAWNYAEPRWLPDDSQKILDLQLGRIDDCVSRFRGLIDTWDVVNEATHFDRQQFKQRAPKYTAMWAKVGQVELTRKCFQRARQANPQATLLINDYRVDPPYARVIEQLVDDDGGRLYDVIGIQSHQHGGTWNNRKIWDVCERFASFGVPLHFTETTVVSGEKGWNRADRGKKWETTPEGEAYQAREVERFYTMLYSHPAVEAITWWDFTDLGAWQRAPAGFLRKDMSPKPAYEVLHKLIKQKWWTQTAAQTDQQGVARFRGTLGDYKVTVRIPGRDAKVVPVTLSRSDKNEFTVRLP